MSDTAPNGFILNDAAMYAFSDQDVFPDIVSFSAAIPPHLRPLFLVPIRADFAMASDVATRVAGLRTAEGYQPDGGTDEADWFGTKTFVYDDIENTTPSTDPGSIFDIDGADNMTHHQDLPSSQDENWQAPTDTSYMNDVDLTDSYIRYPYRTDEAPVRHSTTVVILPRRIVLAYKPLDLEVRAPEKVRKNARSCTVKLVSYDRRNRVFTFNVGCGNVPRTVRASLSDINHVAMDCDCPFWQWNGPEFHAKANQYMLGPQRGTAGPPNVRDPDRKFFLCKHAYSVLTRMDEFVQDVVDDGWEMTDDELLAQVDAGWEKMQEAVEVPIEVAEEDEVDVEWEDPVEEAPEGTEDTADPDQGEDDSDEVEDEDESGDEAPEPEETPDSDDEESGDEPVEDAATEEEEERK